MKRKVLNSAILAALLSAVPSLVRADVTIRYTFEMSSPMAPALGKSYPMVIYMKGNKGVTVMDTQTTIVDFAKKQVTIIDGARKKFATIAAADYAGKMVAQTAGMMPQFTTDVPGAADMLKTMKTNCDTKNSDVPEIIQGVQGLKREVVCTMTMTMPESMKDIMPSMGMKMATRVWSAAPGERLRVPGLWQLSGYELWQNYFMNPAGAMGKLLPDGMKPMIEAMQKDQSAVLRSSTEISMNMPMPGLAAGGAAGDTPFMTMKEEMTGLSTELLDDALFAVPADYSEEPFEAVMGGIEDAAMATVKGDLEKVKAMAAEEPPAVLIATPDPGR